MAKSNQTPEAQSKPTSVSVFGSLRRTLAASFDTVTDVVNSANEGIGIGTTYVSNRSKRMTLVDKEKVMLATAKDLALLKEELDADENVRDIFDKLSEEW